MDAENGTLPQTRDPAARPRAPRPQPYLFLALECHRPLATPARYALGPRHEVNIGRGGERLAIAHAEGGRDSLELRFADPWMSSRHAVLLPVLGRWSVRDVGSRNGVFVNGARLTETVLADGDIVEIGHTLFLFRERLEGGEGDLDGAALSHKERGLATLLPALDTLFQSIAQVARTGVSIILHGESGTGKEVMARTLHALSRRAGALVAVNCGALPATLLEAELFGHKKGAFSGAVEDRPGLVRSADKGTLFLDEIGDLPLASQTAFLRVLQEREVTPVGGSKPVPVDLRVISASHRDLDVLVDEGKFRGDLLARVSGLKVSLPALRERREDLGLLIAALLPRVAAGDPARVTFETAAGRALLGYRWPLNVRELEKVLGAATALAGDRPIAIEHLPPAITRAPEPATPTEPEPEPRETEEEEAHDTLPFSSEDLILREELMRLLEEHRGNVTAVAKAMGKARMQVQRWLKRLELDAESYRR